MNNIAQGRVISNFPSVNKSAAIPKKVKDAIIEKNVEYSFLRTVFSEKGKFDFFQFLNSGKKMGVSLAHSKNKAPNFPLKNSSSAKIIRS